jgi:hypothetical protein
MVHELRGPASYSTHSKRFNMENRLIRYREERTGRRVVKTLMIEWGKPVLGDGGVVLSVPEERAKRIHVDELTLAAISAPKTGQLHEAGPQAIELVMGELQRK